MNNYARGWLIILGFFAVLFAAQAFLPSFEGKWFARAILFSPAMIAAVTIAVCGVFWVVHIFEKRRTDHRMRNGLCAYCGYDLREIDADQCPECGRLIWRPRDPVTGQVIRPGARK